MSFKTGLRYFYVDDSKRIIFIKTNVTTPKRMKYKVQGHTQELIMLHNF